MRRLQLDADVQLPLVASAARGFSGAELAALCNEAAIRAARRKSSNESVRRAAQKNQVPVRAFGKENSSPACFPPFPFPLFCCS